MLGLVWGLGGCVVSLLCCKAGWVCGRVCGRVG